MRTENERKCQGFMMKGRPACKYCWPKCSPIHPWQYLRANFDWQWWERLRAGKGKVTKGRKVVTLRYTVLATMFSSSMSSRMRLKREMWEFDQHQERHLGQISKGMSETNLMRKIPEAQGPLVRRRVGLPWRAHPLLCPNLENIWNNKKSFKIHRVQQYWEQGDTLVVQESVGYWRRPRAAVSFTNGGQHPPYPSLFSWC